MKKYILLFFLLTFYNISLAEEKVFYLDVNFLLNQSEAGKYINTELQKINNKNIKILKSIKKLKIQLKMRKKNFLNKKIY